MACKCVSATAARKYGDEVNRWMKMAPENVNFMSIINKFQVYDIAS